MDRSADPSVDAGQFRAYAAHAVPPPSGDPTAPVSPPFSAASRRIAWGVAALLAAATVVILVWGIQAWQTNRAMASVESSLAGRAAPAPVAAVPAPTVPAPAGAGRAGQVEGGGENAVAATPAPSADRLPPLVLPGQPVPAAVLRDLPEWVASQVASGAAPAVAPVQTSGASGDESAAPAVEQARPQRQRQAVAPRSDRYGAVFARCPGPGESGAVQCRRAVCDGAAKKTAACAPYLK